MIKLFLLASTALLLTACSEEERAVTDGSSQEEQVSTTQTTKTSTEDSELASPEEIESAELIEDYSPYPELSSQDFFRPSDYEGHLITDNPGTRVIIFADGDTQAYKTVFVKDTQRLKVIDLTNNKLLEDTTVQ